MGSASTKLDLNQQNWTVVGELRGSDSSGLATVSLVIDESGAWPAASTSLGMSKIGSDTIWAKLRARERDSERRICNEHCIERSRQ